MTTSKTKICSLNYCTDSSKVNKYQSKNKKFEFKMRRTICKLWKFNYIYCRPSPTRSIPYPFLWVPKEKLSWKW